MMVTYLEPGHYVSSAIITSNYSTTLTTNMSTRLQRSQSIFLTSPTHNLEYQWIHRTLRSANYIGYGFLQHR